MQANAQSLCCLMTGPTTAANILLQIHTSGPFMSLLSSLSTFGSKQFKVSLNEVFDDWDVSAYRLPEKARIAANFFLILR
jgi:hypothetical protein